MEKEYDDNFIKHGRIQEEDNYIFNIESSAGQLSSSNSSISYLQNLDNFEKTRTLYVLGYYFKEFQDILRKVTTISFTVIEEGQYYGVIHFVCGMHASRINEINTKKGFGMKFYSSRFGKSKCLQELIQLSLNLAEEKSSQNNNNSNSDSIKCEIRPDNIVVEEEKQEGELFFELSSSFLEIQTQDEDEKISKEDNDSKNSLISQETKPDNKVAHEDEEEELFIELSSLLLQKQSWGLSDLYKYIITQKNPKKRVMAALLLDDPQREYQFKRLMKVKGQYSKKMTSKKKQQFKNTKNQQRNPLQLETINESICIKNRLEMEMPSQFNNLNNFRAIKICQDDYEIDSNGFEIENSSQYFLQKQKYQQIINQEVNHVEQSENGFENNPLSKFISDQSDYKQSSSVNAQKNNCRLL